MGEQNQYLKMSKNKTYGAWSNMLSRCENRRDKRYESYGGRGIAVCDRWKDFASFVSDIGPRPDGTSLDRINNDGNYEPGNCRWATDSQQRLNRRITVKIEIDGVIKPMLEWCDLLGRNYNVVSARILRHKWLPMEAVLVPACVGARRKSTARKLREMVRSSKEFRQSLVLGEV